MNKWAETILQQLGGNHFIAMTGAKNFAKKDTPEEKFITFKIGRNCHKINHVKVILDQGLDLYNMEFLRVGKAVKVVSTHSGLFFDQLRSVFTENTGMYTRLF